MTTPAPTPPSVPAPLRRLGSTKIEVTRIGLGCMPWADSGSGLAGRTYRSDLSQDGVNGIVQLALESGITWFDSAEMYGRVDGMLATALREARDNLGDEFGDVVIATKWKPFFRTAKSIERGINRQLRNLNLPILHQIHWPMGSLSGLDKQLREFARLHRDGVITGVGVCNFSAAQMRLAHDVLGEHDVPLASNQIRASLLRRDIETNGVLETARELEVSLIGYFPLESGLLTGRYHRDPDAISAASWLRRRVNGLSRKAIDNNTSLATLIGLLGEIGAKYAMAPAQVALAWLTTYYGDTMVAIAGASSAWQARENARAMRLKLTDEDLQRLDKATSADQPA